MPRGGLGSVLFALGILVVAGPSFGAGPGVAGARAAGAPITMTRPEPAPPIDINNASRAQLKTLQGVGDAEAQRIVAGRPYLSKGDLVTRNVLPAGIYQSIRHRIIAIQPGTPRAGKHP